VTELKSDAIVPLFSARGRNNTQRVMRPLARGREAERHVDHLLVGSTNRDWADPVDQRLAAFAEGDIFPVLSDHWVMSRIVRKEQECPTPELPGSVDFEVELDFNAYHGEVTGVALVTYLEDAEGNWEIAAGADAGSGNVEQRSTVNVADSSRGVGLSRRTLALKADLPEGTDAKRMVTRVYVFSANEPKTVPTEPGPADIARAMECP
jgi:hypothetical protein